MLKKYKTAKNGQSKSVFYTLCSHKTFCFFLITLMMLPPNGGFLHFLSLYACKSQTLFVSLSHKTNI